MATFDPAIGRIIICQGEPRCHLRDDQEPPDGGCRFCTVEAMDINGVWHVVSGPPKELQ
jgi:hypothetical protein